MDAPLAGAAYPAARAVALMAVIVGVHGAPPVAHLCASVMDPVAAVLMASGITDVPRHAIASQRASPRQWSWFGFMRVAHSLGSPSFACLRAPHTRRARARMGGRGAAADDRHVCDATMRRRGL